MISLALTLSLGLAGLAPTLPPDEPAAAQPTTAEPTTTAIPEPPTLPEPTPTPVAVGPAAEPLDVTIVGPHDRAEQVARLLAPHLTKAGFRPELLHCDDFGCVLRPAPGDEPDLIVVVSDDTDDTLVIVTRYTPDGVVVVVDEVLDDEGLGSAVTRDLTDPPLDRRTAWTVAKRKGLDRAPPPTELTEPAPPPPPPAFGRGAYLELAGGSSGMLLGLANTVGGGFLFDTERASRFRVALGVHAATHNGIGSDWQGLFFGALRLGLGAATPRVLAMAHLAAGPGMIYGSRYGGGVRSELQGVASLSGSLRGRVSQRVGLGVEVGALTPFPLVSPQVFAMLNVTWIWDVRRIEESAR